MAQKYKVESAAEAFLIWAAPAMLAAIVLISLVEFHHAYASLVFIGVFMLGVVPGSVHASRVRKRLKNTGGNH